MYLLSITLVGLHNYQIYNDGLTKLEKFLKNSLPHAYPIALKKFAWFGLYWVLKEREKKDSRKMIEGENFEAIEKLDRQIW